MKWISVNALLPGILTCFLLIHALPAQGRETADPHAWTGNVNLFLGTKILYEDNWKPVDRPFEGGLLFDIKQNRWFVSFAVDLLYAGAVDYIDMADLGVGTYSVRVESRIVELDMGIRKIWQAPKGFRPYAGGGLAIINGRIQTDAFEESASADDTGYGGWLNGGMYLTLTDHINIGFDARWSMADIVLFERTTRVGGWHVGIVAGFHW
jgi:hypothetical protein